MKAEMPQVVVLDDDPGMRRQVQEFRDTGHFALSWSLSPRKVQGLVGSGNLGCVIVGLDTDAWDGLALVRTFRDVAPSVAVMTIANVGAKQKALESLQLGVFDFFVRPVNYFELVVRVERAMQFQRLREERDRFHGELVSLHNVDRIVATSAEMRHVRAEIEKWQAQHSPVALIGERGVGKATLARTIHYGSPRRGGPFLRLTCRGLGLDVLKREIFGELIERDGDSSLILPGVLDRARGGTLYVEDVEELPLSLQKRLVAAHEKRVFRSGSQGPQRAFDTRLIFATRRRPEELVEQGRLSEKLYQLLRGRILEIPPIRCRREDIPGLAAQILWNKRHLAAREAVRLSPEALQKLMDHDWPENIHELEDTLERALLASRGEEITPDDLQIRVEFQLFQPFTKAKRKVIEEFERSYIYRLMEAAGGNVSQAANLAGKDRSDIYNLMRKYGIPLSLFR
jgi:DNA-binding NtrC family response regulator